MNKSTGIKISIIILVYNKAYEVKLILEALKNQAFRLDEFEIIIVDDGSEDEIDPVIYNYSNELNIKLIKQEHSGNRSLNRDYGIKEINAEIIIFLDGDMIPDRDFLIKHYTTVIKNKKCISMGMRNFMDAFNNKLINEITIREYFDVLRNQTGGKDERIYYFDWLKKNNLDLSNCWFIAYSNNLCLWKEFYLETGGFDPNFSKGWGAEDVEFGFRAMQKGAEFIFNKDINLYHIYHEDDWIKKKKQLLINIQYFFDKHAHWEVELFFYENRIWPITFLEIRHKIIQQIHLLKQVKNIYQIDAIINDNTINIGIIDDEIIHSKKIKNHLLSNYKNVNSNVIPLLGSNTKYNDKEYDYALISYNYYYIDKSFFEIIIKEACRIASKVLIINENGICTNSELLLINYIYSDQDGYISYCAEKKIRFILSVDTDSLRKYDSYNLIHNNYYYANLAYYLYKIGWNVSIEFTGDLYKTTNIFNIFFGTDSIEKKTALKKMIKNDLSFFDNEILTVMDSLWMSNSIKAIGKKIHWLDDEYFNIENYYNMEKETIYDLVLLKKTKLVDSIKHVNDKKFLPVGVDRDVLSKCYTNNNNTSNKNDIIQFLYIDPYLDNICGIENVISSFKIALNKNKNIRLTIIFDKFHIPQEVLKIAEDISNKSGFYYLNEVNAFNKIKNKSNINKIKKLIKNNSEIEFKMNTFKESEITAQIATCDYLIDVNPTNAIIPYVLYAIALGKRTISLNSDNYFDYISKNFFIPVEYSFKSGIFMEIPFESSWYNIQSLRRHFLYKQIEQTSLNDAMIYASQKKYQFDQKIINQFIDDFSWESIAKKFEDIILCFVSDKFF